MNHLSDKAILRLRREASLPDLTGTKYRLIEKIGSGGMGEVYLVEDAELNRNIALKVIGGPALSDDLSSRLLKEAKIVARLEHPSIVPVHDAGKLLDGRTFFTMKYVQGLSLEKYAHDHLLTDLLRTFHKVCQAVAFAHSRGVIHRDLKPENIMVGEFGEVLVMDWGIAKIVSETEKFEDQKEPSHDNSGAPGVTAEGTVMGTPHYMSPEQAQGNLAQIDQRADIYALGGILYFLLTGQHPHESKKEVEDPHNVDTKRTTRALSADGSAGQSIERPRKVNAKISRALEAICLKSMSSCQDDRYGNADLLGNDIVGFLDGQPVSAYPENVFEKANRWVGNNRFVLYLILTYIVMRFLLFLLLSR